MNRRFHPVGLGPDGGSTIPGEPILPSPFVRLTFCWLTTLRFDDTEGRFAEERRETSSDTSDHGGDQSPSSEVDRGDADDTSSETPEKSETAEAEAEEQTEEEAAANVTDSNMDIVTSDDEW